MDPIRDKISATDPLNADPSAAVDGEAALRRMMNEPPAFSDRLPAGVSSLADRKLRRARLAGVLTLAAAAGTAGVLVAMNLGNLTSEPVPASTGTHSATVTPSALSAPSAPTTPPATQAASATATTAAGPALPAWIPYHESTGQATFEIKPGWAVVESPHTIDGHAYNSLEVRNGNNQAIAELDLVYDRAAGGCEVPKPFRILDSVALDIPQKEAKVQEYSGYKGSALGPSRFTFSIIEGDKVYGTVALSEEQAEAGTPVCAFLNGIVAPEDIPPVYFGDVEMLRADGSNAPLVFGSVTEAKAYMQTPEYQDLKRMLISLSLKPSNTVTSTRFLSEAAQASFALPTGWTAKDVPAGNAEFPASGIAVSDETGKEVATFYHGAGGGLGGGCGPEKYTATELDSASSSLTADWAVARQVRFSYRVLDQTSVGKGFSYQVGLVDESSGQLSNSCLMYSVVTGTSRGSLSFADRASKGPGEPVFQSMAEAKAYMGTPEYRKLKEMIRSLQLTS